MNDVLIIEFNSLVLFECFKHWLFNKYSKEILDKFDIFIDNDLLIIKIIPVNE